MQVKNCGGPGLSQTRPVAITVEYKSKSKNRNTVTVSTSSSNTVVTVNDVQIDPRAVFYNSDVLVYQPTDLYIVIRGDNYQVAISKYGTIIIRLQPCFSSQASAALCHSIQSHEWLRDPYRSINFHISVS